MSVGFCSDPAVDMGRKSWKEGCRATTRVLWCRVPAGSGRRVSRGPNELAICDAWPSSACVVWLLPSSLEAWAVWLAWAVWSSSSSLEAWAVWTGWGEEEEEVNLNKAVSWLVVVVGLPPPLQGVLLARQTVLAQLTKAYLSWTSSHRHRPSRHHPRPRRQPFSNSSEVTELCPWTSPLPTLLAPPLSQSSKAVSPPSPTAC